MTDNLTRSQQIRLELLTLANNDTAAAQKAIDYIADDELKFELYKKLWGTTYNDGSMINKADLTVQKTKEALILFADEGEKK
ncbi:DUF2560 family protein [Providencia manganoxydans]|uniref:DUF2560 family protein n=1 Tax=Providencia manganoxydans TaxID=2923283 RepID=UPI0032D9E7C1